MAKKEVAAKAVEVESKSACPLGKLSWPVAGVGVAGALTGVNYAYPGSLMAGFSAVKGAAVMGMEWLMSMSTSLYAAAVASPLVAAGLVVALVAAVIFSDKVLDCAKGGCSMVANLVAKREEEAAKGEEISIA